MEYYFAILGNIFKDELLNHESALFFNVAKLDNELRLPRRGENSFNFVLPLTENENLTRVGGVFFSVFK